MLDVLRVDDKKFSVSLSMYFGVVWKEVRLIMPPPGSNNSGATWLPLDLDFMQHLWVPNVFVYNLVSFAAVDCLEKLAGIWILKENYFFYNQVIITAPAAATIDLTTTISKEVPQKLICHENLQPFSSQQPKKKRIFGCHLCDDEVLTIRLKCRGKDFLV